MVVLYQATTDLYGNCTLRHSGTSAAAPEAAGVFALALEAKYVHTHTQTHITGQCLMVLQSEENMATAVLTLLTWMRCVS